MSRILIVDDSASMRQMVSFTLKQSGHTVGDADNGKAALEEARSTQYNLVITDINMPVMDGITLVSELRKLPAYRFTPILILTTEAGPERKQQGKAAGATGWIEKPFSPTQLLGVVSRLTD